MASIRRILVASGLLGLMGAVVHETRELSRLREQIRHFKNAPAAASPVLPTKASQADREAKQRQQEERQRAMEAADESIRRQRAEDAANPPLISAMDWGGKISQEAIKRLKFTDTEVELLGTAVSRVRAEALEDLVKRMKPLSSGPADDGSRRHSYYARARADRGKAFVDDLSREFQAAIGKDRAEKMLGAHIEREFIGDLGKRDMEFELIQSPGGEWTVHYKTRSPESGNISRFGESSLDEFEKRWGRVFEVAAEE